MAKAKRKRIKQAKARRLHQEPIVRRIADILAKGKPTSFRWSSACRHAVRAALCFKGRSWAAADERAALIVRLALVRIGAQYPTHRVAQGEPPAVPRQYFYCAGCHGQMPEGSDHPWCSDTCHKTLWARRNRTQGRLEEQIRLSATRAVIAPEAPAIEYRDRSCKRCGETFQPVNPRSRYCSLVCGSRAEKFAPRDCVVCATRFKPHQHVQLTCSTKCGAIMDKRRKRLPGRPDRPAERSCENCGDTFAPERVTSTCCSDHCRSRLWMRRALAKRAAERRARPALPDKPCASCGKPFTPPKVDSMLCSDVCRYEARLKHQRERREAEVRRLAMAEAA